MKLIRDLEELIEEEVSDIKKYAKMANELREKHPQLAQVLYTISTQEESHQHMLHSEVVKIVEDYRREHGEPPAAMMAVYEYVHKKHIDKLAEAKRYQEMYRNG
jgi:sulfur relay (sulfurtransferase) DsrC/TusE family protein